jgi:hypothetical protein
MSDHHMCPCAHLKNPLSGGPRQDVENSALLIHSTPEIIAVMVDC